MPELKKSDRYSHQIHSYPAKLLANIPYYFLATDVFCPSNGIVLDPFCGTGTVLLEALLSGRSALGADANPLAELITSVKTNYIAKETLQETLGQIMKRAKSYRKIIEYPNAVAVWYSMTSLRQLTNLQRAINKVEDERQRAFFELCFSSTARKVSYSDPSISVPVRWNPRRFSANPNREKEVREKLEELKTINVYMKFETICKANIDRLETLNGSNWQPKYEYKSVDLKLPRFETSTYQPLVKEMSELGMPKAFSVFAEFPYFCNSSGCIGKMFQVAKIKLDEEGTVAAAVTVIAVAPTGMPPQPVPFHANRPFLYVISEQSTGAIFFIGQYTGGVTADIRTGIVGTKAESKSAANSQIYNLAGQKVNASYKGIVIQNGKKYIIK